MGLRLLRSMLTRPSRLTVRSTVLGSMQCAKQLAAASSRFFTPQRRGEEQRPGDIGGGDPKERRLQMPGTGDVTQQEPRHAAFHRLHGEILDQFHEMENTLGYILGDSPAQARVLVHQSQHCFPFNDPQRGIFQRLDRHQILVIRQQADFVKYISRSQQTNDLLPSRRRGNDALQPAYLDDIQALTGITMQENHFPGCIMVSGSSMPDL